MRNNEQDEISIVKLITAEELLGKVFVDEAAGVVVVRDVIGLGMAPSPDGAAATMQFYNYMPYSTASEKVEFQRTSVVCIVPPSEQLLELYNRATNRIQVPEKKLIIPH